MADRIFHAQQFKTPSQALVHYGVKGMKWGVRKDDKTSAVGADPDATALGVYTALIAGFLIIKARHEYVDSGKKDAKAIIKAEQKSGVKHEWKRKESLTGPKTHDEIMSQVVPAINKGFPKARGSSMNCRRCTFAYEMRRRGYDVQATKSLSATGQDRKGLMNATKPSTGAEKKHSSYWGKNVIPTKVNGKDMTPEGKAQAIFDSLARQPDGARGELAFGWVFGGGHSIAYEVVNKQPVIFDTQSSMSWSSPKAFAKQVTPIMNDAAYTRLDNANLDSDFMKRWVTDAQ